MLVLIISMGAFTACDINAFIEQLAEDLAEELETPAAEATEEPLETAAAENKPPFGKSPEPVEYTMPEEIFRDDLERQASEIIDDAITMAVRYTLTMKDDRHSFVSCQWESDMTGKYGKLSENRKKLYQTIRGKGSPAGGLRYIGGGLRQRSYNRRPYGCDYPRAKRTGACLLLHDGRKV